jgi:predicted permease
MPILADVRHALRGFGRSPIFAATSIASLAIGLAASATIYSLTDALVFAPGSGVRNPAEVVDIGRANGDKSFDNMTHPAFTYLRDHTQTLVGMAGVDFGGGPMSLGANGTSERVFGTMVSANYFDVLGTRLALGRFFLADEDQVPEAKPVVVLTHAFWMRRFNGDPTVLERPLRLNNKDFTVVGVAEPGFQGGTFVGTDLWVPMAMVATARGRANSNMLDDPRGVWHVAVGRLKPGVSREQALAELNTLMAAFKASEPRANPRHTINLVSTGRVPGPVRLPFYAFIGLLFGLTGALLAIACSNVAGMLLARAATRRREMATRLAVGASRARLIGQLLTETFVLFACAALTALPLTMWLINGLAGFLPVVPIPIDLILTLNLRVVGFALAVSLVTAVVFGLAPARHALGGDLAPMLHGANSTADRKRFRLRNVLVAAQVALSLMLVATAFLFLRTLQAAAYVDIGFITANIDVVSVDVALSGYREQQAVQLAERYMERLRSISGVTSVAAARMIPLQGSRFGLGSLSIPGVPGRESDGRWDADWDTVSPDYFQTLSLRIVEGRAFTAADRAGAPRVAIINETFARRAWPGRSAIGQRMNQRMSETEEQPLEVVGVAKDGKYAYISDPDHNFIYVPMAQQPMSEINFFVKHVEARPIAQDLRTAFAQVEPNVPILMMQSLDEATAIGLIPHKLTAWIAGSVGVIGVFLAALGLYGLMAFLVTQRTREIAIRMALGASDGDMQSMVLKQAARLSVTGGIVGLVLAGVIAMLFKSLLVGVTPVDPLSFGGTALLFAVVLALACWTPARRAATTDPAVALRSE